MKALNLVIALALGAAAELVNFAVTPPSYSGVDANDVLTYTLSATARNQFAYSVRIVDTSAVLPTDYVLYWLRFNPSSPFLPKPPNPAQLDLTLLYVLGDSLRNRTHQVSCSVLIDQRPLPFVCACPLQALVGAPARVTLPRAPGRSQRREYACSILVSQSRAGWRRHHRLMRSSWRLLSCGIKQRLSFADLLYLSVSLSPSPRAALTALRRFFTI
jgi:hypothetical protein